MATNNQISKLTDQDLTKAYRRFARQEGLFVRTVCTMTVLTRAAIARYRIQVLKDDPELVKQAHGTCGEYLSQ